MIRLNLLAAVILLSKTILADGSNFYAREIFSGRIPIRAHATVPDNALGAARQRVDQMLANAPRLRSNCEASGMAVLVAGKMQLLSDLPEYRSHRGQRLENGEDFDWHTRGSGALEGRFTSCGEGNLLGYVGDRFFRQDVCVHELAHALMFLGMTTKQRASVINRYEAAMRENKWKGTYASSNYSEFFADLSIAYFGSEIPTAVGLPSYTRGAAWLKNYDPASYAMLDDIYREKQDPGEKRVIKLKSQNMDEIQKLRSGSGGPVHFSLKNGTKAPVRLCWIDFEGRRTQPRDIPPGATTKIESYTTHVFLAVDAKGAPKALYIMDENDASAVVH